MKALILLGLVAVISGMIYLGYSVPPRTVTHCDAAGVIAVAVTKANGC